MSDEGTVKRYNVGPDLVPRVFPTSGMYVLHSDYAALRERCEADARANGEDLAGLANQILKRDLILADLRPRLEHTEAQLETAREDAIEKVSLMSVPEICALNANVVIFSDRQDEKIEILMSALAVAQDYIKRGAIILTQPQILEVVERALSAPLSDKTGVV